MCGKRVEASKPRSCSKDVLKKETTFALLNKLHHIHAVSALLHSFTRHPHQVMDLRCSFSFSLNYHSNSCINLSSIVSYRHKGQAQADLWASSVPALHFFASLVLDEPRNTHLLLPPALLTSRLRHLLSLRMRCLFTEALVSLQYMLRDRR